MSCIFRATGFNFLVDSFLREKDLQVDSVWRKGKPHVAGRIHRWSGFSMIASSAPLDDIQQQINDAVKFLEYNEADLRDLHHFLGVEDIRLDFGIENRDVAVQYDYFPADLLLLAGSLKIGIEISRYPCLNDED